LAGGRATFFITNSIVQDLPNEATLPMGNGPDRLFMPQIYALPDGIKKILSQTSPSPPINDAPSLELELLLGWDVPKI
jgi:hypothetical protein